MLQNSRAYGLALLVVVGMGAACTGGPGGTGSTSSSSGGGMTSEEFFLRVLEAQCDMEDRCAAQVGRTYSSRSACVGSMDALNLFAQSVFGMTYVEFIAAQVEVTDQAGAAACIEAVRSTTSCTDEDPLFAPPCAGTFRFTTGRTEGQACGSSDFGAAPGQENTACQPPLQCDRANNAQCGVCKALKANGATCTTAAECDSGICTGTTGSMTCTAPPGLNEPCTSACAGNLLCTGSTNRTCQARVGAGQACDFNCYTDLRCEGSGTRVCVAPPAEGQACNVTMPPRCDVVCVPSNTSTLVGTCQSPDAPPGAGQACAFAGNDPVCAQGTYAAVSVSGTTPVGCECKPTLPDGQPCSTSRVCQSGACNIVSGASMGTCGARFPLGAVCEQFTECASYECEYDNATQMRRCVEAPLCN